MDFLLTASPADLIAPGRPDCSLIKLIHRDHDGYISFHRQNPENPSAIENLCSVPARTLPGIFDQLVVDLETDSYFGVNGFYRSARWKNNRGYRGEHGLLLGGAHRDSASVRWLTCCFADIDCTRLQIDVGTAIGKIITAQDDGTLPAASIITRSGRGIWLFWLLGGEGRHELQQAWPERRDKWARTQTAICNQLATIGGDANSKDLARITRVPGSINTKANVRVSYWPQFDDAGRMPVYTLAELAKYFGVVDEPKPAPERAITAQNIYTQRGSKGQIGRWIKARKNFERLWQLRGKFAVGTRSHAVFYYTIILKSLPGDASLSADQIEAQLLKLYHHLEQPAHDRYTLTKLKATIHRTRKGRESHIRNQTIADGLDITPAEAELLSGWPPATRFGATNEPSDRLRRPDAANRRRGLLKAFLERSGGVVPSAEALAEFIESAGLKRPSRPTVASDLKAIGIQNPRARNAITEGDRRAKATPCKETS